MAARLNATAPLFIRSLHFTAQTVILINILSEPLREPDNHYAGDCIALLSVVANATSDKVLLRGETT